MSKDEELGNRVIREIKAAHAFRQVKQVGELSRSLLDIPVKEYQLIGQYYLQWCGCREKKYHASILENVIEQSRTYKTRALQTRAAIEVYQGNFAEALHFYAESSKTQPSVSEYIETTKGIASIKSVEGFHDLALKDLESLVPILRYAEPFEYYDILNSYAVELGMARRKDEARNISNIVLASPFAYAYPEWRETAEDLKSANRPFVDISPSRFIPRKVLHMPVVKPGESAARSDEPAPVLNLQKWKKKMGKGKKGKGGKKKLVEEMTEREMFFEIMNIYSSDETTDNQRRRIFDAVVSIMSEPDEPEPDEPNPDDPEGA